MEGINELCINAEKGLYASNACVSTECLKSSGAIQQFQYFLNEKERLIISIPTVALNCSERILQGFDSTIKSIETCDLKTYKHL